MLVNAGFGIESEFKKADWNEMEENFTIFFTRNKDHSLSESLTLT